MLSQKHRVRTQTLRKVSRLSKSYRQHADTCIHNTLTSLQQYTQSHSICFYVSTKQEVDTIRLIKEELALKKKRIIVPKIEGNTLKLYKITSWKDLHTGAYSLLEPKTECKHVDPKEIDIFIVPGIAFGKDKTRIGRGEGYYDRLLHDAHGTKISLAYDEQISLTVPHGAKDVQLDIIVTETALYL
jgi:5-formyltetrahydrofolate cyclo-ligase